LLLLDSRSENACKATQIGMRMRKETICGQERRTCLIQNRRLKDLAGDG
jgi:hypothetical protein